MTTALLQPGNTDIDVTCDRCPARGKVRYVFPNQHDLVFCGHHNREHQDKVTELTHLRIDVIA